MRLIAIQMFFALHTFSAFAQQTVPLPCTPEFEAAPGSYDFVAVDESFEITGEPILGKVWTTRLKIFDTDNPRENNLVYRWANRFHIKTKDEVVRDLLLIEEGQPYSQRVLDESERILRRQKYLYDATIRPVSQCAGKVDIEVITRDIWSFNPEMSFKRSGGESTYRISLRETNLFGSGQELALASKQDLDRESTQFTYKNENIQGSRLAGRAVFSDNDDGSEHQLSLALPFYKLDSRRAWQVRFARFKRDDTQYFRGNDISEVRHENEDYLVSYGFSRGLVNGKTRRWTLGYRYQVDNFSPGDELVPPTQFPIEKRLSYPFLQFTSVVDHYTTAFNFDQIHRTEDLHLGSSFLLRLGYASSEFGSNQDRLVFSSLFADTIVYNEDVLWRHQIELNGLWNLDTDISEDIIIDYNMRYFHRQTKHRSFFASVNAVYTKNLNTNQQVVFGGETGARGFDNRLQAGDRRYVFTLEERLYSDIHLFNLVRLGAAIFIDVGRAWVPGTDDGFQDKQLANVGFGLRLASTKADAGRVIHIDWAVPISNQDDPDVDSGQLSISIKNEF